MDTAQSIWAGIALVTTLALCFMPAPYGRHAPTGASFWTRGHNSRIAFFVMEFPAFFIYLIAFVMSPHKTPVSTMFFLLFELHYTRRTFLYPLKMKIVLMAICFNSVNGFFLTRELTGPNVRLYPTNWLTSPRYVIGAAIFLLGWYGVIKADNALAALRKPGETCYRIPYGGLFNLISCPNYFCEACNIAPFGPSLWTFSQWIAEWIGFAVLTSTPAAWLFVLWVIANLVPRAFQHHKWYLRTFPEYPKDRKALIPFLM